MHGDMVMWQHSRRPNDIAVGRSSSTVAGEIQLAQRASRVVRGDSGSESDVTAYGVSESGVDVT